jgi:hypothetical protein
MPAEASNMAMPSFYLLCVTQVSLVYAGFFGRGIEKML